MNRRIKILIRNYIKQIIPRKEKEIHKVVKELVAIKNNKCKYKISLTLLLTIK
jgi:hypothetical protein